MDLRVPPISRALSWKHARVREVLQAMPARERELLMRIHVDGESPDSAAARLGIPAQSVNRAVAKAMARLARRLRQRLRRAPTS